MTVFRKHNLPVTLFFAAAVLAHLLLLLIPVTRELARQWSQNQVINVRVTAAAEPVLMPEKRVLRELELEAIPQPEPETETEPEPESGLGNEQKESPSPLLQQKIIASQFLLEEASKQSYLDAIDAQAFRADYFSRDRASLDDVLNAPVLQLPFRDTRIYEVAHYEAGFDGAMDKFWDTVSVPFGFTTRNNMRVECVWVLILAGCAWDHKTAFHREARRRKAADDNPY